MAEEEHWPGSHGVDYFDELSDEEKQWMKDNSEYINQDRVAKREILEGEAGSASFEDAASKKSLADVYGSTPVELHYLIEA